MSSPSNGAAVASLLEPAKIPLFGPEPGQTDRSKFMGGSDIPALLGLAPAAWKRNSPVSLYYDKITPRSAEPARTRGVLSRGKRWESVVAEMLVEELTRLGHEVEIVNTNRRYLDPDIKYFAAEIDFEIRLDGAEDLTNVELKTVHPYKSYEWGESYTDSAPDHYIAQTLWGLGVTRRRHAILAPLFGADEIRTFPIGWDEETVAGIRRRAQYFWTEHVLKGIPPDPTSILDLQLLFPGEAEGAFVSATEELTAKLLRLRAIHAEMKAREMESEALEFDIKRAMGQAPEIRVGDDVAATWKARPSVWLDQAALKEAHPKLVKEFTRSKPTRVFLVKNFKAYAE